MLLSPFASTSPQSGMCHDVSGAAILGSGVAIPPERIDNEELVASYNAHVAAENALRAARRQPPLEYSSVAFIAEASGIHARHVLNRSGVLDPARMVPLLPERSNGCLSIQAEFAVLSARQALADAGLDAGDIDLVICACAHHQRPYPAIAIEVQKALGCGGAAFDMNVACSSATFATHVAAQMVQTAAARNVLVCSPEIMSGHLNYRDRKTHFIFGDASAALVIGRRAGETNAAGVVFDIVASDVWTDFSSNIRSNFGFLNRTAPVCGPTDDKLVTQVGQKVFRDIVNVASQRIAGFVDGHGLRVQDLARLWLHQANLKLIQALVRRLGGPELLDRAPIVLDEIGNVASPGSIIAFHRTRTDVPRGGFGLISAFGAGYSIGSLLIKRAQ